ncbi:hypothetical protein ABT404_01345 [Streptomyces hyaluromycini]|uniref:Uncharacterized protein n=1 Tax=Streptomyces hyaluromycini TaxID=1377993 RepID=A0ABV1WMQ2_9ACTN
MPDEPLPENPTTPEPERIRSGCVQGTMVVGNYNSVGSAAVFLAGATLLPFVQAVWAVVGTRAGERLDDTTRGALRRILRRELEQGAPRGSSPAPRLLTTPGGTQIRLDADMPEEALPQLLAMVFERLEEGDLNAPALVRWHPAGWLATVARSGQLYDLTWDSRRSDWVRSPASSNQ